MNALGYSVKVWLLTIAFLPFVAWVFISGSDHSLPPIEFELVIGLLFFYGIACVLSLPALLVFWGVVSYVYDKRMDIITTKMIFIATVTALEIITVLVLSGFDIDAVFDELLLVGIVALILAVWIIKLPKHEPIEIPE